MKILLFTDNFAHIGGAETYFLSLVKALKEDGHVVSVFSFSNKQVTKHNFKILKLSRGGIIKRTISSFFFNYEIYRLFRKFIDKTNPEIIHLGHNQYFTNSILNAIKESKKPAIQTLHDYSLFCPRLLYRANGKICNGCFVSSDCLKNKCLSFPSFLVHKITYKKRINGIRKTINCFIAPSKKLRSYLNKNGIYNVIHLPYFLDLKQWDYNQSKKDRNTLLYVGRLSKEKGVYILIKAMKEVISKVKNAKLLIVGDGSAKGDLIRLSKKLGINNNILFIGSVPNEKIGEYYHKSNILVLPTTCMEQFGFTGIEAMASGTACVGSDIGGIPEWLKDKKTGYLFRPGDKDDLAEKIIKILKNPEKAKKFAITGNTLVRKKYGKKEHIKKLEKIYNQVIAQNK